MRLLMLSTDRGVFEQGSAVNVRLSAYAQHFEEIQVIVFSTRAHGHTKRTQLGHNVYIYPTNSFSRWFYLFDAIRIAHSLRDVDIITTQDPFEVGLAAWFIARRRNIPLHMQVHTDFLSPEFRTLSFFNQMRVRIARFVLLGASRIRVVSNTVAEKLRARYPHTPVSVLPIFVDVERYRSLEKKPHPRFKTMLLWIGRFEKEKDPELAIRALTDMQEEFPDTGLVMLGSGVLEQELHALAKKLGVDDRVEFAGWQDPRNFLGMTSLLLVTSEYEGYGRQVVEALAAGVPVLSTDVGVAREAGAIVTSKKEFIGALKNWLDNGPRDSSLKNYPYRSFAEYVEKYCADIEAAVT